MTTVMTVGAFALIGFYAVAYAVKILRSIKTCGVVGPFGAVCELPPHDDDEHAGNGVVWGPM